MDVVCLNKEDKELVEILIIECELVHFRAANSVNISNGEL